MTSSITGTSNTITVAAAAATHFTVSAPASATAGSAFSFTVTALDPFNNTATGYTGTVHFTRTDSGSGSSVPADYTFVAGDNGAHTFTGGATLVTTGAQTLTATATTTSSITGTSNTITVAAAAATHFSVSAPATATAGGAFLFTVTALDAFNNTATGYSGTAHFTSSDGQAVLPANSTLSNGTGAFVGTLKTAGAQTVAATDTVTSTITGTSNTITVAAAAATHFTVSAPASATAGAAFSFTVTAQDAFNNTVAGYTGTAHFTSSDGQAILPANSTLTSGTGTFTATLETAGSQTLTATDTVSSSITGTSGTIAVSAAAATHFSVSAPASATAGGAFNFTVTAQDAFNNTAAGYSGTVHFTSSDGQAALPINSTLSSGVGTFSVTLKTAGSQTLTATDTVTSTITGTSNTITVAAAAATHFSVSAPASATAGSAFSFTVTALDAFNNTASGYTGVVHFSSTDGQAALPANNTLSSGVGTFSATLKTAGAQTLTATDTATSSITGTSGSVSVSAATLNHFLVSAPANATTGTAITFTVTAVDAFNNFAAGYSGTVHFTSSDATAVLPADSPLTNGVGTFSATLNTSGSQTLAATDTVTSSLTGTSAAIAVRGLVVTAFTPTLTGFTVAFSKPFVNSSASPLNLYDAGSAGYGAADVTLVGSGGIGTVKGSLLIDPSNQSFTFLKTDLVTGGGTSGLLAAGTYTVTLVSGATAFKDATGAPLDGNNDGVNGDSYVTTFTVAASTAVAVTVPDFARGPDATDPINVPNNSTNGIPIALSNGAGVTDGTFVLNYNANLLTITGGTVNTALTGATFTVSTSGSGTNAQATITFHTPTALASGVVRLGGLAATVPANAPYKAKELLHFGSLSLNGGAITAVGDDGVHVVAFLGDTSGDGTYTSADSVLISNVAAAKDSGFAAYPILDPAIVGDITGDGRITSADATALNLYLNGTASTLVPPYPGVPANIPAGPDPALSIPTDLRAGPGGTVTVPVNIDDPHPRGSTGMTQALLALTYDPAVFAVSAADIRLGSVPAAGTGWTLQTRVDAATGQIAIILFSVTPITSSAGGSLVTIDFHVKPGAAPGVSPINLAAEVNPNGQGAVRTAVDDNQGPYTLTPAPTDAPTDPGVDGLVQLIAADPVSATLDKGATGADGTQAGAFVFSGYGVAVPAVNPVLVVTTPTAGNGLPWVGGAAQKLADRVFLDLAGGTDGTNGPAHAVRTPHEWDALLWDGAGETDWAADLGHTG